MSTPDIKLSISLDFKSQKAPCAPLISLTIEGRVSPKKSRIWLWGSLLALIVGGVVLGATLGTVLRSSKDDTRSDASLVA